MQVIAHRGASAYAPENTYAAFDLALQMGAPALETDIQVTRDGVLVLMHDSSVDRTSNGHGVVSNLLYEELTGLDAGSWVGSQFAGERIPKLDDFLHRYGNKAHCVLEVKNNEIAGAVLDAVLCRGLLEQVTFTSFSFEACCTVLAAQPQARVGLLYNRTNPLLLRAITAVGVTEACPKAALLQPADVATIHTSGLAVRTWGVGNETLMRRVYDLGVDGTTVNFPDKLLALIEQRSS